MNRYERELRATSGRLSAETDYFLGAGSNINASESIVEQETRSMYGFGQVAYKGMMFFDFTARNDWSSTLTSADANYDNSYFYPSFSLSGLISEMVEMPSYISFAKVRASWAQVGKATDPYATSLAPTIGNWNFGLTTGSLPKEGVAQDLKPELSTSWEIGADVRLFGGRLGFDFTYYNEETKNQILRIDVVQSSGYEKKKINAGLIKNAGIEMMLTTVPVKTNDFKLGLDFNFAKNEGTLEKLESKRANDDFFNENIRVTDFHFGSGVWAVEGGKLGDIRGTIYERDEQGRLVVDDQGLPKVSESSDNVIGNIQPDWTGSINLNAEYKGLYVSALVSIQEGGEIISSSERSATSAGTAERTVKNDRMAFFVDGVTADGNTNNTIVSAEKYYRKISSVDEEFVYDASHMKLKEVAIGYNLPKLLLDKIPGQAVQNARISFVGRNLMYFYKNTPGTVPDASAYSTAYSAQAFDFAPVPTTRTYGFSLNIGF